MSRAEAARPPVAQNRKARHEYFIEDKFEAGLMLKGTEVKSLRAGKGNIVEAYAAEHDGAIWLFNATIPEYASRGYAQHESKRPRKLLLHRREMDKLMGAIQREGVTLVPLSIYFNRRGIAKVELGLARGKKQYDKRETEKRRDWDRQRARLLRERG
jgi:SsrA-binding protein